jgi:hypothetical protein
MKKRKPLTEHQKLLHSIASAKYRMKNRDKVRKQSLKSYYKRKAEKINLEVKE